MAEHEYEDLQGEDEGEVSAATPYRGWEQQVAGVIEAGEAAGRDMSNLHQMRAALRRVGDKIRDAEERGLRRGRQEQLTEDVRAQIREELRQELAGETAAQRNAMRLGIPDALLGKQGVVGSSPIISTTTTNSLLSRGADDPSLG